MDKYMKIAINAAKWGITKNDGGPFGAVIVKDGTVIASGHNHVISNNDPTCHGEIDAIRKACSALNTYDLSGCELYTTAYPCPMCLGAIQWANISKVYYGCNVEDTEDIGFKDKSMYETECPIECIELDRSGCLDLFNQYVKLDRSRY